MRRAIAASIPLLLADSAGLAQTQWVDPSGGFWAEADNWDPMTVPLLPGDAAQINLAGGYVVTIDSVSPDIDALLLTNPAATLGINRSRTLQVGAMHNDALVLVNATSQTGAATIRFRGPGTLDGAGMIALHHTGSNARLETSAGTVLTNGVSHTICGLGEVRAALVNEGLVSADVPGQELVLSVEDKANNGLFTAVAGGRLEVRSIEIDQTGGGVMRADGGVIAFDIGDTSTVVGGALESAGGSSIVREHSGVTTLRGVTNRGDLGVNASGTVAVTGSGLTNDGVVLVNANDVSGAATLRFDEDGVLGGTGRVTLARSGAARISTGTGVTLTNGPDHVINGVGDVRAAMINDGTVRADLSGEVLLVGWDDKVNNATFEAASGAELTFLTMTLTQNENGVVRADGGLVSFDPGDNVVVVGGSLETVNGGTMVREHSGVTTLRDVTNRGTISVNSAGILAVVGSGLVNEDTVLVNANDSSGAATLRFDETGQVSGPGTVRLNRSGSARVDSANGITMTNAAGHTIAGEGQVRASLINQGLISADVAGESLEIGWEGKANAGLMEAINGAELKVLTTTIDQSAGGTLRADGGEVVFDVGDSPTIVGGTLETTNGGRMRREHSGVTTLDGTTNAGVLEVENAGELAIGPAGATNEGLILINSNRSTGAAYLSFPASATLRGAGELRFNHTHGSSRLTVEPDQTATLGADLLVTGNARFDGDVVVRGTLAPGLSIGEVHAFGTLSLTPSATLEIEVAAPDQSDSIEGLSDFAAAGLLLVEAIDGHTPALGDIHTIVTATAVTGEFDQLDVPPLNPGLAWRIRYDSDSITLVVSCNADYNIDGSVNTLDVLAFLNDWAAGDPRADINGDGSVNTLDVLAFLNIWTGGC